MRDLQLEIEEDLDGCGLDGYLYHLIAACRSKADLQKEIGNDKRADMWEQASKDLSNIGLFGL